jgi:hypothetical protein
MLSDPAFWDKGLGMIEGFIDQLEALEAMEVHLTPRPEATRTRPGSICAVAVSVLRKTWRRITRILGRSTVRAFVLTACC